LSEFTVALQSPFVVMLSSIQHCEWPTLSLAVQLRMHPALNPVSTTKNRTNYHVCDEIFQALSILPIIIIDIDIDTIVCDRFIVV